MWERVGTRVGGGAVAAALGIVAPMLATSPQAAPATGAGLSPFSSCASLRDWYVDQTIDQVGAFGWNIGYGLTFGTLERSATASAGAVPLSGTADLGVTNGATGTNTQEAGVDEPDVAKTDGRIVVQLRGEEVVVTDVAGTVPRRLSTWSLPAHAHPSGLLLVDSHALITSTDLSSSDLYDLDLSTPSSPRLVAHTRWSGRTLSLRQYGDTVRLVTSTGLPALDFVRPGKGVSAAEATARNRRVVEASTIQQWLPHFSLDGASTYRAVDCDRIYRPEELTGSALDTATVGVFTLHPGTTAPASAAAVTGRGAQVYSSSDRLYVWDTSWGAPRVTNAREGGFRSIGQAHTDVHAFALDGTSTRYVGSARIDGQARDRWSFDEHDGHLRVAVTRSRTFDAKPGDPGLGGTRSDNGVVVLDEHGGHLVQVGSLRGLGTDEQLQSVRWFDDLAVLVTFRQTDPLLTVDLSDPEHPRALGELRLPGFSSYLHPIGRNRLLGLGTAGTSDGRLLGGAKAAVFDLADPTHARQLGDVGLGSDWFTAEQDAHAFTWLGTDEGAGTAITQVETTSGSAGLVALGVDDDGRVSTSALPSQGGREQRALPLPDGRVALVGDQVALVADPAR